MNESTKVKELVKQSTTLSGVVKDALGSMGTIICCLIELLNMQMYLEKNELKDRKEISLYGHKSDIRVHFKYLPNIDKCS
jgi:hypothetical protein